MENIEKVQKPMYKVSCTVHGYLHTRHYANKAGAQFRLSRWIVDDLLPLFCNRFDIVGSDYCSVCGDINKERLGDKVLKMLKSGESVEEIKRKIDVPECGVVEWVSEKEAEQADSYAVGARDYGDPRDNFYLLEYRL